MAQIVEGDIASGVNGMGLGWARLGCWRIVAYAQGGYSRQRKVPGDNWCLLHDCDAMPPDVEAALCKRLDLPVQS